MRIKTHPGEILNEEFLIPLGISSHYLSKQLIFGTSSQFWLNLQTEYDISKELQHNINEFNKIVAYSGKE